jgi:hypothetical protein
MQVYQRQQQQQRAADGAGSGAGSDSRDFAGMDLSGLHEEIEAQIGPMPVRLAPLAAGSAKVNIAQLLSGAQLEQHALRVQKKKSDASEKKKEATARKAENARKREEKAQAVALRKQQRQAAKARKDSEKQQQVGKKRKRAGSAPPRPSKAARRANGAGAAGDASGDADDAASSASRAQVDDDDADDPSASGQSASAASSNGKEAKVSDESAAADADAAAPAAAAASPRPRSRTAKAVASRKVKHSLAVAAALSEADDDIESEAGGDADGAARKSRSSSSDSAEDSDTSSSGSFSSSDEEEEPVEVVPGKLKARKGAYSGLKRWCCLLQFAQLGASAAGDHVLVDMSDSGRARPWSVGRVISAVSRHELWVQYMSPADESAPLTSSWTDSPDEQQPVKRGSVLYVFALKGRKLPASIAAGATAFEEKLRALFASHVVGPRTVPAAVLPARRVRVVVLEAVALRLARQLSLCERRGLVVVRNVEAQE